MVLNLQSCSIPFIKQPFFRRISMQAQSVLCSVLCLMSLSFAQTEELGGAQRVAEDSTIVSQSIGEQITAPAVDTEVLGEKTIMSLSSVQQERFRIVFSEGKKNTDNGAIQYFVGLGLQYLVATPLVLVGVANRNAGMALGGVCVSLAATGFRIAGPIRCGIGTSMTYDIARKVGLKVKEPSHWGFYKVGWICVAGSTLTSLLGQTSTSYQTAVTMSIVSLGFSIAADALWTASCVSALSYTNDLKIQTGLTLLDISPYYAIKDGAGLMVTCGF